MATYVNNLKLTEIATGDESGTWGDTTNTNLTNIADALGYGTLAIFDGDADKTFTIPDGSENKGRAMYFKITGSATLSTTRNCTLTNNDISRVMFIENATTGGRSIVFRQAGGSGSTVTISNGKTKMLYFDGSGTNANVVDISNVLELGTLTVNGDATITNGGLTLTGDGVLTFGAAIKNSIEIPDNTAQALQIEEGNNALITFNTTNSSEEVQIDVDLDVNGSADISGDLTLSGGGDGALQFTNAGENSIKIPDNQASALIIEEADTAYMTFTTTNSSEKITVAKELDINADADISGDLTLSGGGDGALQFTNAGENSIKIPDDQASALIIEQADNRYMAFTTTNGSEEVKVSKHLNVEADVTFSGGEEALTFDVAGKNSIRIPDNQASSLVIEQASNAYMTFDTTNNSEIITSNKDFTVADAQTLTCKQPLIKGQELNLSFPSFSHDSAGTGEMSITITPTDSSESGPNCLRIRGQITMRGPASGTCNRRFRFAESSLGDITKFAYRTEKIRAYLSGTDSRNDILDNNSTSTDDFIVFDSGASGTGVYQFDMRIHTPFGSSVAKHCEYLIIQNGGNQTPQTYFRGFASIGALGEAVGNPVTLLAFSQDGTSPSSNHVIGAIYTEEIS